MRAACTVLIVLMLTSTTMSQEESATKEVDVEIEYPLDLEKIGIKLPTTYDPELRRLLNSKFTTFYKLPQVWQHYVPASRIEEANVTTGEKAYYTRPHQWGIYYASYNPEFHANGNFPWETTIGLNTSFKRSDNPYKTFNFINFPEDENGTAVPILIINDFPIKWIYPSGTTVGEVIYVTYNDKNYIQEVRTRKKSKDSIEWEPGLYRPIISQKQYEQETGYKGYTASKKHFHFRNPQEDEVFSMSGLIERLPALNEEKVKELLNKPFQAVDVNQEVWSPAADQDFHILPKDYCFNLLGGVDVITCADCHRQTQISVRNLTPKDPDVIKNPLKVGNIRGSDAVFTWHPFKMSSVQKTPDEKVERISLRDYDLTNNYVLLADPNKQYGDKYKLTKFVQSSLKEYELPPKQFIHPLVISEEVERKE